MPTMTLKNPYNGVNAHLHSIAQNPERFSLWAGIHSDLITYLVAELNRNLPPNYIATSEQSLQIVTENEKGVFPQGTPRPDVSVYRRTVSDSTLQKMIEADSSIRVVQLEDFLNEEDYFWESAVVYKRTEDGDLGHLVTRFELLSTSNKVGSGKDSYLLNRHQAMLSGTSLVEIDLLHQTYSPLPGIVAYPDAKDSHPYTIAVTDVRRKHNREHVMLVYVCDVDVVLPTDLSIPLADDDFVTVDMDAVYQLVLSAGRKTALIDYDKFPRKFETYSQADQDRIKVVMERAKELTDAE